MVKNKHLQRLAIILSCVGIIRNTVACKPEAIRTEEYWVELFNKLNGSTIRSAQISLTQQQVGEIKDGKCPEGFIELLDARFNAIIRDGPEFYSFIPASYPKGLEMRDGKIIVSTVKQKLWFHAKNHHIYIRYSKLKRDVCVYVPYNQPEPEEGNYYNILDLYGALNYIDTLYFDGDAIHLGVSIRNNNDLIKLCDSICFLEGIAETRGTTYATQFLEPLWHPEACSLIQCSQNKYILRFRGTGYPNDTVYEFFLRDETEKRDDWFKNWYEQKYAKYVYISEFDYPVRQANLILEKIKFLEWEYSFKKDYCIINIGDLSSVEHLLRGEIRDKLGILTPFAAQDYELIWKNFNLEGLFAPIEKNLSFLDSLCKTRDMDIFDVTKSIKCLNSNFSRMIREELSHLGTYRSELRLFVTKNSDTKSYSINLLLDKLHIYELGIELIIDHPVQTNNHHNALVWIDTIRDAGGKVFLDSIKLFKKQEYKFRDKINLTHDLSRVIDRLNEGINFPLHCNLVSCDLEERLNSIDLAEAMRLIEETRFDEEYDEEIRPTEEMKSHEADEEVRSISSNLLFRSARFFNSLSSFSSFFCNLGNQSFQSANWLFSSLRLRNR